MLKTIKKGIKKIFNNLESIMLTLLYIIFMGLLGYGHSNNLINFGEGVIIIGISILIAEDFYKKG